MASVRTSTPKQVAARGRTPRKSASTPSPQVGGDGRSRAKGAGSAEVKGKPKRRVSAAETAANKSATPPRQRTESSAAGFDRRTVTIPVGLVAEVEGRVGNREFSAYVTEALRRKIEQDKLDELLADWAISEDVRTQTLTDLDAALSRSE